MTYDELNAFILNYLDNDITGRAIILTGEWGSGKSYYVKNTLKPFLEEKKHKCAIVSLYGLTSVSEISKAIYIELRTIKKETESEVGNTAKVVGKIVGKTIINGLISKIGVDIGDISDADIQKVYDSIDLSGKLIVLEDIERTQIDIIELLGYINNMCENDGVKVLLVANEEELIQFHIEEEKNTTEYGIEKTSYKKIYDEKSARYLKAKEKTISDTLHFQCNYIQTIESIIDSFESPDLQQAKEYLKNYKTNKIYGVTIANFREFIVACQKACDIFNCMKKNDINANDEFKKCVSVGLVMYLQKRIVDNELPFKSKTSFDSDLSDCIFYPLMRFCYDYYNEQILDPMVVRKSIEEYSEYLIYINKTSYNDVDLRIIYDIYTNFEKDINSAIDNIYIRLSDINDISLNHYDRIINSLLILKYDAEFNNEKIDLIIERIILNLKGRGERIVKNRLFTSTVLIESSEGKQKFEEIKKAVFESLEYSDRSNDILDANDYPKIIHMIYNNTLWKSNPNELMEMLPLDRLIEFIRYYSPDTMDCLRYIFNCVNYRNLKNEYLSLIENFKTRLEEILKQESSKLDRIQKLQLRWTCKTINDKLNEYNN